MARSMTHGRGRLNSAVVGRELRGASDGESSSTDVVDGNFLEAGLGRVFAQDGSLSLAVGKFNGIDIYDIIGRHTPQKTAHRTSSVTLHPVAHEASAGVQA